LHMLTIGRNSLLTAIMALRIDCEVYDLEDLRDEVNKKIKELKSELKDE